MLRVGHVEDRQQRALLLLDVEVDGAVVVRAEQEVLAVVLRELRLARKRLDNEVGLRLLEGRSGKSLFTIS
jgi:hypothetical protein